MRHRLFSSMESYDVIKSNKCHNIYHIWSAERHYMNKMSAVGIIFLALIEYGK